MKNEHLKHQKIVLRKAMLAKRNEMSQSERERISERICSKLWSYTLEHDIKTIHSYLPMRSEVNVLPLLQKALEKNLTVVAPKTLRKRQLEHLVMTDTHEMESGIFNTYHPKDAEVYVGQYDLIIVAGLAFDQMGYRLGYGGGYYDSFLSQNRNAKKVGVCYPFQLLKKIPIEDHDIKLDLIIN